LFIFIAISASFPCWSFSQHFCQVIVFCSQSKDYPYSIINIECFPIAAILFKYNYLLKSYPNKDKQNAFFQDVCNKNMKSGQFTFLSS
jgi:hypothetical protein